MKWPKFINDLMNNLVIQYISLKKEIIATLQELTHAEILKKDLSLGKSQERNTPLAYMHRCVAFS